VSDWKAALNASLLAFLQQRRPDAVALLDWYESADEVGTCAYGTCGYSTVVIDMTYRDSSGATCTFEHEGSFADLMRALQ
jgi:hypothetical protein